MIKLVVHDIFRDGGTQICFELKNPTVPYYIDQRIGSSTKGKVFDQYPGDPEAEMLDIEYTVYNPYAIKVENLDDRKYAVEIFQSDLPPTKEKSIGVVTRSRSVFISIIKYDLGASTTEGYIQLETVEQTAGRRWEKVYVPKSNVHYFSEMTRIIQALDRRGAEIIYL